MDLLNIKPHKISRDISGYITYIYGAPKVGKTTLAAQAPDCLLLAFESGYRAIDGVLAQDITSWGEMKKVYKELKKPEVQAVYKTLIIDTVDLAAKLCSKYICSANDVDELGDIAFGKGYSLMRSEFEDVFNSLALMGYAIIFIGHDEMTTITEPNGQEYNIITPALSPAKVRAIIANMADIYGYAHCERNENGIKEPAILTLRDNTGMITCGTRFKYMRDTIPFSYQSLVDELNRAIDEEEKNGAEITEEAHVIHEVDLDFQALKEEFNNLVSMINENTDSDSWENVWAPKITFIVENVLGKGRKVNDLTEAQADQMDVIISDLKSEVEKGL